MGDREPAFTEKTLDVGTERYNTKQPLIMCICQCSGELSGTLDIVHNLYKTCLVSMDTNKRNDIIKKKNKHSYFLE